MVSGCKGYLVWQQWTEERGRETGFNAARERERGARQAHSDRIDKKKPKSDVLNSSENSREEAYFKADLKQMAKVKGAICMLF